MTDDALPIGADPEAITAHLLATYPEAARSDGRLPDQRRIDDGAA